MGFWRLLNGPEDIGRGPLFWLGVRALLVGFWPGIRGSMSEFEASSIAYYLLNIPMALGLCLLWGYCGILSFGQVAYFGIAGYLYGIIAGNLMGNQLGAADRLAGQSRRLRRGGADLRLLRLLRPGADVDRPHPHPGLHPAARDLPRPDRRLPVARRHGPARRLQRDDRHPVVPARRAGLLRLPVLLLRAARWSCSASSAAGCWSARTTAR